MNSVTPSPSLRSVFSVRIVGTPFLPLYSTMQSYLQGLNWSISKGRQGRVLLVYAALIIVSAIANCVVSGTFPNTVLPLGLTFPGAGFLPAIAGDQAQLAFILFLASLSLFGFALLLWFATGNVLAPPLVWVGLAFGADNVHLLGMAATDAGHGIWPWLIGPIALIVATLGWLRAKPVKTVKCIYSVPCFASPRLPFEPMSHDHSKRLRLLLDRALQPVETFNGFERRDQFQTAALRYQVNFTAYALAFVREHRAPAAKASFFDAQERLLHKIGDKRLWSYWRLENAWGNMRLAADPIPNQNIMYSGFTALQMALGGGDELHLHSANAPSRSYSLNEIADRIARQYRAAAYGLLDCEPNWIYPLCNLITMAGIKAADARLGSDRWEGLAKPFLDAVVREGMRADGSFIAFRSSLTGFAPPAPGGIVMQAFPCLFLNALSPELAQQQWHKVRQRLDLGSWRHLFWPVDVGNYGFSRASSYAATAAAAVEMGDRAVADECLRRLEEECPSCENEGVIHRENASLWAHALELMARSSRRDGLRDLVSRRPETCGPHLASAPYPDALILQAVTKNRGLDLTIEPGRLDARPQLEFGGLMPERHYRTGLTEQPYLRADREGRAMLRVALSDHRRITLDPIV